MKYLLAFVPAALIALCFAGYAAAQSPPAAPTGVTVLSSGEGVVIIWDENDMATHWIAWMNRGEYESARAAGEWTAALNYAYVPTGDAYVVSLEHLIKDDDYWFIAGSASRWSPSAVSWGAWESAPH